MVKAIRGQYCPFLCGRFDDVTIAKAVLQLQVTFLFFVIEKAIFISVFFASRQFCDRMSHFICGRFHDF
jgi:hypothetical protein